MRKKSLFETALIMTNASLKGLFTRFYTGGPLNRLQLRNTVYLKSFTFFRYYGLIKGVTDRSNMVHQYGNGAIGPIRETMNRP